MPSLPFVGATIASTLYLGAILALSFAQHQWFGWRLALLSAGLTYLCYWAQVVDLKRVAFGCSIASILAGAAAGIATVL